MFDPIDDQQRRDDEGIEKMLATTPAHTPEPWRVDHDGFTLVGNDVVLGSLRGCPGTTSQEDDANANRIVACVNTCARITDDELRLVAAGATLNVRLGLLAAAATMASIRIPRS